MVEKPHINLITAGHVDSGKSTLIGRLLYETGIIKEEELKKLKEEAKELKKETFEYAFIMDRLKEERIRGLTIDIMHRPFETQRWFFTIIDCPGHRDFVKNMITGASQGDAAIFVISAKPGEGIQEQTREHAWLMKIMGINQLVVVINKMDAAQYSKQRYEELVQQAKDLLSKIGYKAEKIPFIPLSALMGENITKPSDKMPWYTGPTFIEALDKHIEEPAKPIDKPLRIPVQDVYSITGVGTVPVGRIETGVLKEGDTVVFEPAGVSGEVRSIEIHHRRIKEARAGDNIGFNVRGISKQDIKRGDVAGHPNNPPSVAKEFIAQIVVLQHPTVITTGYTPVFHCHTASVACKLELVAKVDPRTGAVLQEHPDYIRQGDAAKVKVIPTKPFVIERQADFPELAKFAIRDMGMTIAAGVCLEVTPGK